MSLLISLGARYAWLGKCLGLCSQSLVRLLLNPKAACRATSPP